MNRDDIIKNIEVFLADEKLHAIQPAQLLLGCLNTELSKSTEDTLSFSRDNVIKILKFLSKFLTVFKNEKTYNKENVKKILDIFYKFFLSNNTPRDFKTKNNITSILEIFESFEEKEKWPLCWLAYALKWECQEILDQLEDFGSKEQFSSNIVSHLIKSPSDGNCGLYAIQHSLNEWSRDGEEVNINDRATLRQKIAKKVMTWSHIAQAQAADSVNAAEISKEIKDFFNDDFLLFKNILRSFFSHNEREMPKEESQWQFSESSWKEILKTVTIQFDANSIFEAREPSMTRENYKIEFVQDNVWLVQSEFVVYLFSLGFYLEQCCQFGTRGTIIVYRHLDSGKLLIIHNNASLWNVSQVSGTHWQAVSCSTEVLLAYSLYRKNGDKKGADFIAGSAEQSYDETQDGKCDGRLQSAEYQFFAPILQPLPKKILEILAVRLGQEKQKNSELPFGNELHDIFLKLLTTAGLEAKEILSILRVTSFIGNNISDAELYCVLKLTKSLFLEERIISYILNQNNLSVNLYAHQWIFEQLRFNYTEVKRLEMAEKLASFKLIDEPYASVAFIEQTLIHCSNQHKSAEQKWAAISGKINILVEKKHPLTYSVFEFLKQNKENEEVKKSLYAWFLKKENSLWNLESLLDFEKYSSTGIFKQFINYPQASHGFILVAFQLGWCSAFDLTQESVKKLINSLQEIKNIGTIKNHQIYYQLMEYIIDSPFFLETEYANLKLDFELHHKIHAWEEAQEYHSEAKQKILLAIEKLVNSKILLGPEEEFLKNLGSLFSFQRLILEEDSCIAIIIKILNILLEKKVDITLNPISIMILISKNMHIKPSILSTKFEIEKNIFGCFYDFKENSGLKFDDKSSEALELYFEEYAIGNTFLEHLKNKKISPDFEQKLIFDWLKSLIKQYNHKYPESIIASAERLTLEETCKVDDAINLAPNTPNLLTSDHEQPKLSDDKGKKIQGTHDYSEIDDQLQAKIIAFQNEMALLLKKSCSMDTSCNKCTEFDYVRLHQLVMEISSRYDFMADNPEVSKKHHDFLIIWLNWFNSYQESNVFHASTLRHDLEYVAPLVYRIPLNISQHEDHRWKLTVNPEKTKIFVDKSTKKSETQELATISIGLLKSLALNKDDECTLGIFKKNRWLVDLQRDENKIMHMLKEKKDFCELQAYWLQEHTFRMSDFNEKKLEVFFKIFKENLTLYPEILIKNFLLAANIEHNSIENLERFFQGVRRKILLKKQREDFLMKLLLKGQTISLHDALQELFQAKSENIFSMFTKKNRYFFVLQNLMTVLLSQGWLASSLFELFNEILKKADSQQLKWVDILARIRDFSLREYSQNIRGESLKQRLLRALKEELTEDELLCLADELHHLSLWKVFRRSRQKNLDELITEFDLDIACKASLREMYELYQRYFDSQLKIQDNNAAPQEEKFIKDWSREDFRSWSVSFRQKKNLIEPPIILAILAKAIELSSIDKIASMKQDGNTDGFQLVTPRVVQILFLLLLVLKDKASSGSEEESSIKGYLAQISTGEGKTTIVAMWAAYKALHGHTVDIVTSSSELAVPQSADQKIFFEDYLGLSVGHNHDDHRSATSGQYLEKSKNHYQKAIVYGDAQSFQRDILTDEYSKLETRVGRPFEIVIVDEVDSMLIDGSSHLVKLSTPIPGMEYLEAVLCVIWQQLAVVQRSLKYVAEEGSYYTIIGGGSPVLIGGHHKANIYVSQAIRQHIEKLLDAGPYYWDERCFFKILIEYALNDYQFQGITAEKNQNINEMVTAEELLMYLDKNKSNDVIFKYFFDLEKKDYFFSKIKKDVEYKIIKNYEKKSNFLNSNIKDINDRKKFAEKKLLVEELSQALQNTINIQKELDPFSSISKNPEDLVSMIAAVLKHETHLFKEAWLKRNAQNVIQPQPAEQSNKAQELFVKTNSKINAIFQSIIDSYDKNKAPTSSTFSSLNQEQQEKFFNSFLENPKKENEKLSNIHQTEQQNENESTVFENTAKEIFTKLETLTLEDKLAILYKTNSLVKAVMPKLPIPEYFRAFVLETQLDQWIDSALIACRLECEQHYMLDNGNIIPIDDANTGLLQTSLNWSNGLHQFLQLKHGYKIKGENITTNLISNLNFFQRYQRLYGMTGTLGSMSERDFLSRTYSVQAGLVPTFRMKRHKQLTPIIVHSKDIKVWFSAVVESCMRSLYIGQAVLVITKYIRYVKELKERFFTAFQQVKYDTNQIKVYSTSSDANVITDIMYPRSVIIATNIAGRGTDIKCHTSVEINGGLHVCITFLPANARVEGQNMGRTSRSGLCGTSQLVLQTSHSLSYLRQLRDQKEEKQNLQYREEAKKIKRKESVFKRYCNLLDAHYPNRGKNLTVNPNTELKVNFMRGLEEKFGFWLCKNDGLFCSDTFEKEFQEGRGIFNSFITEFEKEIQVIHKIESFILKNEGDPKPDDVIKSIIENNLQASYRPILATFFERSLNASDDVTRLMKINPAFYVLNGNALYEAKNYWGAIAAYSAAIELDNFFSLNAYYARAVSQLVFTAKAVNPIILEKAKQDFVSAKKLIETVYEPMLQMMQKTAFNPNAEDKSELLLLNEQISHKFNLYGIYKEGIDYAIGIGGQAYDEKVKTLEEEIEKTSKKFNEVNNLRARMLEFIVKFAEYSEQYAGRPKNRRPFVFPEAYDLSKTHQRARTPKTFSYKYLYLIKPENAKGFPSATEVARILEFCGFPRYFTNEKGQKLPIEHCQLTQVPEKKQTRDPQTELECWNTFSDVLEWGGWGKSLILLEAELDEFKRKRDSIVYGEISVVLKEITANGGTFKIEWHSIRNSLSDLENKDLYQEELKEFESVGFYYGRFTIKRQPPISVGDAIGMAFIALGQIILGAALAVFTLGLGANIALGLVSEGFADLVTLVKDIIINKDFDWTDWGIQKGISLAISIIAAGFSALKDAAQTVQRGFVVGKNILTQVTTQMTKTGWQLASKIVLKQAIKTIGEECLNYLLDNTLIPAVMDSIAVRIRADIEEKLEKLLQQDNEAAKDMELILAECAKNRNHRLKVQLLTKIRSWFYQQETKKELKYLKKACLQSISKVAAKTQKWYIKGVASFAGTALNIAEAIPEIINITQSFCNKFKNELHEMAEMVNSSAENGASSKNSDAQINRKTVLKEVTEAIAEPMVNIIEQKIACPVVHFVNQTLVDVAFGKWDEGIQKQVDDFKKQRHSKFYHDPKLRGHIPLEVIRNAVNKATALKQDSESLMADIAGTKPAGFFELAALSAAFDRAIHVFDRDGNLMEIFGENCQGGVPFKLIYHPTENGGIGHYMY